MAQAIKQTCLWLPGGNSLVLRVQMFFLRSSVQSATAFKRSSPKSGFESRVTIQFTPIADLPRAVAVKMVIVYTHQAATHTHGNTATRRVDSIHQTNAGVAPCADLASVLSHM